MHERHPRGFRTGLPSLASVVLLAGGIMVGCAGEKGSAPSLRPMTTTLAAVRVTPINAIMAVGDTMSLVVQGRTITGTPVTDFDSVEYLLQSPTDSLRIRIAPTGLLTALASSTPNSPVVVTVIGFKDGAVSADQAIIQVVANALPNATLSIQPIPPDSAKVAWGTYKQIIPVIRNTAGQSVASPTVRYEFGPGDSTVMECYTPPIQATATLSLGQLQLTPCGKGNGSFSSLDYILALRAGTAWVHANVRVFGVALHDSVQYTLTNQYTGRVQIGSANLAVTNTSNQSVMLAPGGVVTFINNLSAVIGASISWTFSDSTAATAASPLPAYGGSTGNIPPLTSSQHSTTRRFNTPGIYTYTATVSGGLPPFTGQVITGKITVQ